MRCEVVGGREAAEVVCCVVLEWSVESQLDTRPDWRMDQSWRLPSSPSQTTHTERDLL